MIANKNQLKKAIKENKIAYIERVYNLQKDDKIKEGSKAIIKKVQSNAFTVIYDTLPDKEPWIYYDNIEVKDNFIIYYGLISEERLQEAKKINQEQFNNSIDFIELDEQEKQKYNKYSNYNYSYKYITIKNYIMEA